MPNLLASGWPVKLGGQRDSLIKAADLSRLISGRNRGPLRSGRRLERIEPAGEIEVVAEVSGVWRAARVVDHDRHVEFVQRPCVRNSGGIRSISTSRWPNTVSLSPRTTRSPDTLGEEMQRVCGLGAGHHLLDTVEATLPSHEARRRVT